MKQSTYLVSDFGLWPSHIDQYTHTPLYQVGNVSQHCYTAVWKMNSVARYEYESAGQEWFTL